jgi:hypothetical protein
MNQNNSRVIAMVLGGVLLLSLCQSTGLLQLFSVLPDSLGAGMLVLLLALAFGAYKLWPHIRGLAVPQSAKQPISAQLHRAFSKNYTVRVRLILSGLPDWPIRPLLLQTADELFALKFSVQRAREEGVPASFLQRITGNIERAAEGTWQIASKLDAVAQQRVDFRLIEPKVQQEMLKLQQLIDSLKQSQEGIALLTLSEAHQEAIQNAEFDLQALARAVKVMEQPVL